MKKKMLFVWGNHNCACTKKCTFELEKGLRYFFDTRIIYVEDLTEQHFISNDVIYLQRLGANGPLPKNLKQDILRYIYKYRNEDKLIIYSIDDLILNNNNKTPLDFISAADAVSVTHEYFNEFIKVHNKNVIYTGGFVDASEILNIPKADLSGKLKILYASTHGEGKRFMELLVPKLFDKYPQLTLYTLGRFSLSFKGNILSKDILSFNDYISHLKACDLMLSPFDISTYEKYYQLYTFNKIDFLNCKAPVKYLEASLCETPVIATSIYPYKNAIKNYVNGFSLENNVTNWLNAVDYTLKNRSEIVSRSLLDVSNNYILGTVAEKLYLQIDELLNKKLKNRYN